MSQKDLNNLNLYTTCSTFIVASLNRKHFQCNLCNGGNREWATKTMHEREHCHQEKVRAVKSCESNLKLVVSRLEVLRTYRARNQKLGLQNWRGAIDSLLVEYILTDAPLARAALTVAIENGLKRFEFMEGLALLELAIWKQMCKANPPQALSDYCSFLEWDKRGWKEQKANYRPNQVINVIIMNVLPFLGRHYQNARART